MQYAQIYHYLNGLNRIVTEMLSPDFGTSTGSAINSSAANPTGEGLLFPRGPQYIESEPLRLGVMDRDPSPPPELKNDAAEDEHERGTIRPFMKDEDDDVDDAYGVDGLRYENGELLLAREDEAIASNHWVGDSRKETQKQYKKAAAAAAAEVEEVEEWSECVR